MKLEHLLDLAADKVKAHYRDTELHADVFADLGGESVYLKARTELVAAMEKPENLAHLERFHAQSEAMAVQCLFSNWKACIAFRLIDMQYDTAQS